MKVSEVVCVKPHLYLRIIATKTNKKETYMQELKRVDIQEVNGGIDPVTAIFLAGVVYGFFTSLN